MIETTKHDANKTKQIQRCELVEERLRSFCPRCLEDAYRLYNSEYAPKEHTDSFTEALLKFHKTFRFYVVQSLSKAETLMLLTTPHNKYVWNGEAWDDSIEL
jgi:hypothetical protein